MIRFIIIAVVAWLVGVFGWSQIIGSIQNIRTRKKLLFPLILWTIIMAVGACLAIMKFDGTWSVVVGYAISFIQVIRSGRIE